LFEADRVIMALGVDLGQSPDYSAIATVDDDGDVWTLNSLERLPLGLPYPVKRVTRIEASAGPHYIMVDAGGPGRLVIDMMRAGGSAPTPVVITARGRVKRTVSESWSVPKATLMERMAAAMEQDKLKVACDRYMADVLAAEMRDFVGALTQRGSVTIEARRTHDDLILATALAMWARAEHDLASRSVLFAFRRDCGSGSYPCSPVVILDRSHNGQPPKRSVPRRCVGGSLATVLDLLQQSKHTMRWLCRGSGFDPKDFAHTGVYLGPT
jgi:hypothetical protein